MHISVKLDINSVLIFGSSLRFTGRILTLFLLRKATIMGHLNVTSEFNTSRVGTVSLN